MLCTIAQNWTVFGTRYHRGIMVSLSKVWTSSICWVLFLLKIGTLNCSLWWFRWFGIV